MIHVRDAIRKVERDYKLTTQNNTVEYLLKDLEAGGRYSISVRLRNMSKEASFTLSTGTRTALKGRNAIEQCASQVIAHSNMISLK